MKKINVFPNQLGELKKTMLIMVTVFVFASVIFFSSCEKEIIEEKSSISSQSKTTYLEFESKEEFAKALEHGESNRLSEDFVSMLDIYIKIEETENKKEKETLIEKYKDILIIDKDSTFELIVIDPVLASYLSPEGLIKVGNEISLVEFDKIKTITGGDISKIEILVHAESDSPENNIKVEDFKQYANSDKAEWSGNDVFTFGGLQRYKIKWSKWASYSPWNSSAGGSIKFYKEKSTWYGKTWATEKANLYLHVRWDYIKWTNGGYSFTWQDGHIHDSKYGWWLTERRYAGAGVTPNPVYGLKIDGSAGGRSFTH